MRGTKRFIAERDYYQILGIDDNATSRDVDDACARLSRPRPIDAGDFYEQQKEAERLMLIAKAAEVLGDPIERSAYDRRRFGSRLPENDKIEALFNNGIKAYKQKNVTAASRYLREAVHLYPHRSLYRVHLAITYMELGWQGMAENELKTALRIDPHDGFAQETVARLLYRIPDKQQWVLGKRWHKQAASIAAGVLVCAVGLSFGAGALRQVAAESETVETSYVADRTPPQPIAPAQTTAAAPGGGGTPQSAPAGILPKLAPDFQPTGQVRDYTSQEVVRKTYYPVQGLVMAACKDGGMLTYKPAELMGWKQTAKGLPVLVSRNGELIPAPGNVPLLLPNGNPVNLNDPTFPVQYFPEYAASSSSHQPKAPVAPQGA